MSATALRKIAAMPREELRFRLVCEARKWRGRIETALHRPRWSRADLTSRMRRDAGSAAWADARAAVGSADYAAAHRLLLAHFATRRSAFPLGAREVPAVAAAIRTAFPQAPDEARTRGDAIVRGEYDLLGYRGLRPGTPPDWHTDPVHLRRAPDKYWAAVPYLDPMCGDHKIVWELNRHQHWLSLARAAALTNNARYRTEFIAQLESWVAANPPLRGTNWASMLEIAFRCLSWLWALEIFATVADDGHSTEHPWTIDLLLALDRQLVHVEHNLSRYFSPNTHLSGEALGLYVAGHTLPELVAGSRRAATGREVLVREAERQVRADGGHAELSGHYHRYSTDFYLLALATARRAGDPAASVFERAARTQAGFLRTMADDRGIRPQIGDDDGGQLFPMCGRDPADCRDTLAIAAILLDWPDLAIGPVPEEAYWMCGVAAGSLMQSGARSDWTSAALDASGYYVSRTAAGDHLIFDAGPHGYLNGGHAHSDALSIVLTVAGEPLLIDPGTGTYTMDAALRDRFRSTAMHNTVVLNGQPQSHVAGPFHWRSMASAHAPVRVTAPGCDYFEGTHDGYLPVRHTRSVVAIHGVGWWILDHVLGSGQAEIAIHWHLHPAARVTDVTGGGAVLTHGEQSRWIASSLPLSLLPPDDPLACWAPAYGRIERAPVLRSVMRAAVPFTAATFVSALPTPAAECAVEPVEVTERPASDWHAAAFRLRHAQTHLIVTAAIEQSGVARDAISAPPTVWGTTAFASDARVAVLLERANAPTEAILINGSSLHVQGSAAVTPNSARLPFAREVLSEQLASTVHVPAGVR